MGNIDRNQIYGFLLLILMYGAYMYFVPPTVPEPTPATTAPAAASATPSKANAPLDSAQLVKSFGTFASLASGTAQPIVIENEDIRVRFSTAGGSIEEVVLKKFKTHDAFVEGQEMPLKLIDDSNSDMEMIVQSTQGPIDLKKLYYQTSATSQQIEGDQNVTITFEAALATGQKIQQIYTVKGQGYQVDYQLAFQGMDGILKEKTVQFNWTDRLKKLENDLQENRKAVQINYFTTEEEFEDIGDNSVSNDQDETESPLSWFSFKQKYFVTGFVSRTKPMTKGQFSLETPENDSMVVKSVQAQVQLDLSTNQGDYTYFFGPNEYRVVSQVAEGFHRNVYLGYDLVKPINRFIFVPMFEWFDKFISNYGLLIIVVVLAIKIAFTPLIYKSYVSAAKMRILAPEINAIREKVGDDQVKVQQETMKLYQEVGVSPLSGCVPMLLQMPILMSVFFLFPNMIMFRQESFLWASDLSTYDAPITWATSIPLIGNHISLFVVLMTLSSLAFTYYNNQITPAQPGPIDMKKISYIFPLVFFFVLNSFPAALSFYYLVSNLVTIAQQLIVRRFVDEDKIKEILAANKVKYQTKPKKTSKFTEYLQKQLQATEEAKKKQLDTNEQKRKNMKK